MRVKEFVDAKVFEQGDLISCELWDCFLTPELEAQKATAKPGDVVTMYKVIEKKENGNIVYAPYYPTLEQFTIYIIHSK